MPLFLLAVKLRIKSFKVPELLIEIPETATVGSLKVRTRHMFIQRGCTNFLNWFSFSLISMSNTENCSGCG
jgi:hypothetical protein